MTDDGHWITFDAIQNSTITFDSIENKFYPQDFKFIVSEENMLYVTITELNEMCDFGVIKIDRDKLKEYYMNKLIIEKK